MDHIGGGRVNRRGFLTGAIIAPLGAIVAAKTLPTGYVESAETKLRRWFTPRPPLMKRIGNEGIWSKALYSDMRTKHMHELTKYISGKVDESVFNMMKGDLDGKG